MRVRDFMQRNLVTVLPSTSIEESARKMAEQKIGSILIASEGGKLEGILTDRDIALAVAAEGKDPRSTSVCEVMTQSPLSTEYDSDLDSALKLMNRAHTRRLPVTDHGKLVGIVSSTDVACAFKEQFNQFIGLEEAYARH